MDKFKHKLPKEELKRYAKEVSRSKQTKRHQELTLTSALQLAKKLVNSDFKHNRVEDPNQISEKKQKQVKKFCKEYFDKAVVKHREYEKKRAERKAKEAQEKGETPTGSETKAEADSAAAKVDGSDDEDFKMSDNEGDDPKPEGGSQISTPPAPPPPPGDPEDEAEQEGGSLKRKRDGNHDDKTGDGEHSPIKRPRSQTPPPPPPPPPEEATVDENRDEDHPMGGHNDTSNGKMVLDHIASGDLPADRKDELKPSQMSIEGKV